MLSLSAPNGRRKEKARSSISCPSAPTVGAFSEAVNGGTYARDDGKTYKLLSNGLFSLEIDYRRRRAGYHSLEIGCAARESK
jgi:hypothetical protein